MQLQLGVQECSTHQLRIEPEKLTVLSIATIIKDVYFRAIANG